MLWEDRERTERNCHGSRASEQRSGSPQERARPPAGPGDAALPPRGIRPGLPPAGRRRRLRSGARPRRARRPHSDPSRRRSGGHRARRPRRGGPRFRTWGQRRADRALPGQLPHRGRRADRGGDPVPIRIRRHRAVRRPALQRHPLRRHRPRHLRPLSAGRPHRQRLRSRHLPLGPPEHGVLHARSLKRDRRRRQPQPHVLA